MEPMGGASSSRRAPSLVMPYLAAAVYLAALGLWQLFGRDSASVARWVSDLAPLPAGAAAVATAVWASRRAPTPRLRLAWLLVAAAFGLFALGDAVWFVYEVVLGDSPYPSAADVAYLAMYPVLVAALLAFPAARRSRRQRATLTFDYGIVFLAAALGVWCLVIGPTALHSHASRLEIVLSVAYPVADLVVLFGLLTVLARGIGDTPRCGVYGLFAGVACFLVSDLAFGYLSLHHQYRAGDWPDTLWIAASLCVVIAAWPSAPRPARVAPVTVDETGMFSQLSGVPFLMIVFVWAIVMWETFGDANVTLLVLVVGGMVLTTLVFVRQLTAQRDARLLMQQYHALANADGLTGLASRRRFFEYGARAAAVGNVIVTRAPRGATFAIETSPPCSSTIFFTITRPSPVPRGLLVTYGSKTRFMRFSGNPVPLSVIVKRTALPAGSLQITILGVEDPASASCAFCSRL